MLKKSQVLQPESFGFFSGLVEKIHKTGRLASRIRGPQQTDEDPNNSFWCCLPLGLLQGLHLFLGELDISPSGVFSLNFSIRAQIKYTQET